MKKISSALPFILATAFGVAASATYAQGIEPYPVKGQVLQVLESFDNPEGAIFSADGKSVFISNSAELGMPDKGFHWTHKGGYISKLSVQSDGTLKMVKEKLIKWGVSDYKAIFSRAVGLNMVFAEVPAKDSLSQDFVRNYYRYADHMFECSRSMKSFALIRSSNFDFDLFASGEYSRMLEREWQEN